MTTIHRLTPLPDEPSPLQPAATLECEYRNLMSCFPTGVAVVTALDGHSESHGMTCTSLASVTLNPPTLLVCLCSGSGTLRAARATRGFGVNLLRARARRVAEIFSSPAPDRFAKVPWRPSEVIGVPWLENDTCAFAECRVTGISEVGDHAVVLGEVVHAVSGPHPPLLYGMRRFAAW